MEFNSSSKTSSIPFRNSPKSTIMHRQLPKLSRMHTYNMHASTIFNIKNTVEPGQLFSPSLHAGDLKRVFSTVCFVAKQLSNVTRYASRICQRISLTSFCRQSFGQTLRHCELFSSLLMML